MCNVGPLDWHEIHNAPVTWNHNTTEASEEYARIFQMYNTDKY